MAVYSGFYFTPGDTVQHVKTITHNLKGGGEAELGQRTLIIGPNGSGKSAIVNAVELALTGKASDLQGRDVVAAGATLATLTNGSVAYAQATLSDGAVARWEGKAKGRATRTGPAGVFPLRAVTEGLTGSADKARKFLLAHVCADVTEEAVLAVIPAELHAQYRSGGRTGLSPVENLQHVSTEAAKRARDTKKRAEEADSLAAEISANDHIHPESLAALSDELSAMNQLCTMHQTQLALHKSYQPPVRSVADLEVEIAAVEAAVADVQAMLSNMEEVAVPVSEKSALRQAVLAVVRHNRKTDHCTACLKPLLPFENANLDTIEKAVLDAEQRMSHSRQQAQEQRNLRGQYEVALRRGESKIATLRAQQESLRGYPAAPKGDVVEIQAALERAQTDAAQLIETLSAAQRANAAFAAARTARDRARALGTESRAWAELTTACKRATEEMILDAIARFTARVQRFLPENDKFGLQMTKTTCRVGLWRDSSLHTAVSGAEWARVMAAVACACTPSEAALPVLVPEDRAWDAKTLKSVLKGLDNYPGQVLVATTIKPYRSAPKGWTTIELGGDA